MDNSLLNIKININSTKDIINDVNEIINKSRQIVYQTIDIVLLQRNWLIGKRIYEEEIKDTRQENYGKGFSRSNLYSFYRFYREYQNIFQSVIGKSLNILSFSHYSVLLSVTDLDARKWYEKEAIEARWSARTLQRNIDTQYYYRLMASQVKEPVMNEMIEKTKEYQQEEKELDNSVVAENATTGSDGKTYYTKYYNLDMIIAVGYRVKSKRGVLFRKWATNDLKEYLLKGYSINENRVIVSNENYIELRNEVVSINDRLLKGL